MTGSKKDGKDSELSGESAGSAQVRKPYDGLPRVLVTGASSGIGKACAELFARGGYEVYGVSRSVKRETRRYKQGGILRFLPMDVTDAASVKQVTEKIGPVDVAILSAGFGIAGAAEEVPIELARQQMEVNYFGVLRVVSAVLPAMRKRMYGRIILIGSLAGRVSIPMQSHYSSSKYALSAYADALRMELAPYDIDVTIIEPGDTKTGFTEKRRVFLPEGSPYREKVLHAVGTMEKDEQNGGSAEDIARLILSVARSDHPKAHIIPGMKNKLLGLLIRSLPDRAREAVVKKIYL